MYVVSPSEVATGYSGPAAEVSGVACVTETIDIAHVPGVHPSEWSRGFGITNLSNSLEFYIGAGSMQLASMMRQEGKGVVMNPALEAMMPTARFETNAGVWNTLKLGDGGNIENTASLALLRRKCKEVLAVVGTSTGPFVSKFSKKAVTDSKGNVRPPPSEMTREEYDAAAFGGSTDLASLFGVPVIAADGSWNYHGTGFNYRTNKVFGIERYYDMLDQFEAALKRGAPLLARLEGVEVLRNAFHGVEPYTCNYTVLYNHAPKEWLDKVPLETLKKVLGEGEANTKGHFPYYKTTGHNPPTLMEFTPLQTNLLADMMAWIVDAEWDKLKPCFS